MSHMENSPRRALVRHAARLAEKKRLDPGLNDWMRRVEAKERFEAEQMLKQTMPVMDPSDPRGDA